MPRKIRELETELKRAGFKAVSGKGSHRHFVHLTGAKVTISGQTGGDAKHYQEQEVAEAIADSISRGG